MLNCRYAHTTYSANKILCVHITKDFEILALRLHTSTRKEKHQERANHPLQRKWHNTWYDGFLKLFKIDSNDLRRMFITCFGLFDMILDTVKFAVGHLK